MDNKSSKSNTLTPEYLTEIRTCNNPLCVNNMVHKPTVISGIEHETGLHYIVNIPIALPVIPIIYNEPPIHANIVENRNCCSNNNYHNCTVLFCFIVVIPITITIITIFRVVFRVENNDRTKSET